MHGLWIAERTNWIMHAGHTDCLWHAFLMLRAVTCDGSELHFFALQHATDACNHLRITMQSAVAISFDRMASLMFMRMLWAQFSSCGELQLLARIKHDAKTAFVVQMCACMSLGASGRSHLIFLKIANFPLMMQHCRFSKKVSDEFFWWLCAKTLWMCFVHTLHFNFAKKI